MLLFTKNVKENLMQFNSDMIQMLLDLKNTIADKPDMCEEELTTDMLGIFTYLFGASEYDNIYRKYRIAGSNLIADIAVATSELSFKKKEADIIIEMKRCEVTLSMRNFKQLIEYMLRARASWGILSNGYFTYFYRLEDIQDKLEYIFTNDFDISDYAFLTIGIHTVQEEELIKLKEFSDECFKNDDYIKCIKTAEFNDDHSGVFNLSSCNYSKESLFYFDEKMFSIDANSAAYCLLDTEKYDLFKEVILTDKQNMYTGIDILSLSLFIELNEEERVEYLRFARKMKDIFDTVLKCIQNKADAGFIQQTFINSFIKAMGYKEFSKLSARDVDISYREYLNICKTIVDSREEITMSISKRNYVTPLIYSTSDCPFIMIVHDSGYTKLSVGEDYIEAGKSLVIETNGNMFALWMKVQDKPISYNFMLKNMSFSIMYDFYLLSKEKYNSKVMENLNGLEHSEVYLWNRKINERYENRIKSVIDVNKHVEIVKGGNLPKEFTFNSDINTLMLETLGLSEETCDLIRFYNRRLDRCEQAIQKILKVLEDSQRCVVQS